MSRSHAATHYPQIVALQSERSWKLRVVHFHLWFCFTVLPFKINQLHDARMTDRNGFLEKTHRNYHMSFPIRQSDAHPEFSPPTGEALLDCSDSFADISLHLQTNVCVQFSFTKGRLLSWVICNDNECVSASGRIETANHLYALHFHLLTTAYLMISLPMGI